MNVFKCPANKSYMCSIGACATDPTQCPTSNGCPANAPVRCELAGVCAITND